jgi:hypothetical protein
LNVEVTDVTYRKSPTEQVAEILHMLFTQEIEDALDLAKAPDKEDSPSGNPEIDRVFLAGIVKRFATPAQPWVLENKVAQIMPLVNRAAKKVGVDRKAIAAKKAEILAIQGSQAAVADEESQSPNTRRPDEATSSSE